MPTYRKVVKLCFANSAFVFLERDKQLPESSGEFIPMPSPPRVLIPGKLHFVTTRVERGLPFVCTEYMNLIIMSVMARAQVLYNIRVCAFLWMGNHMHMLIVLDCPESLALFIDRIKTETSHAINILRGERNLTLWADGYDSPPVLTVEDAIEKFVYLYTNPAKANLESSISRYPGTSSWKMFSSREYSTTAPWIQRPMVEPLPSFSMSEAQHRALAKHLIDSARESHTFILTPDDWMECFNLPRHDAEKYRHKIFEMIKETEEQLTASRQLKVIGASALKRQKFNEEFSPKKYSRRMWCICWDREIRKQFITYIKNLQRRAREVYELWKKGDFSKEYPKELFPPRVPKGLVTTPSAA
jgi:REP element-mobilizing transposase RayT